MNRTTKTENWKIIGSLKKVLKNMEIFKTTRNKLTALGNVIHSNLN